MYGFVLCDIALICQYHECTNGPAKLISQSRMDTGTDVTSGPFVNRNACLRTVPGSFSPQKGEMN